MQKSIQRTAGIYLSLFALFAFTRPTAAIPQQSTHSLKLDFKSPLTGYELHPQYGRLIIKHYFNQFIDHLDSPGLEGMNFFFKDETEYELVIVRKTTWAQEFCRPKGYDVQSCLPALMTDIGPITPKTRLDYAVVMASFAEERYFKPVHQWYADRNLIHGSDNNGRGLEPLLYGENIRATRWFTAPGNRFGNRPLHPAGSHIRFLTDSDNVKWDQRVTIAGAAFACRLRTP